MDGATHAIYNDGESGTPIAEYDYLAGRTLRRAMKNGIAFDMRDGSGTHYDGLGRPLRWAHVEDSTMKIGFEYSYDQAGNRLQQRNLHDPLDSQRFAYDSSSRIVASSRGDYPSGSVSQGGSLYCDPPTTATWTDQRSAFQWILDGAGNWDRYDTVMDSTLTSQTRTDTNFNEYATVGGTTLTHNDNGDMTSDGSKQFKWDAFGRLREVRTTTGSLIATYFYDADHRRVRKDLASGVDFDILFSGWQAIEYRDSSSQAVLKQVVFGNYLDEALCLDTYSAGSIASTDYYHQNGLYSVYGISNASGVIIAAYQYDPYGSHILLTDGDDGDSAVNFNANDIRTANGSIGIVNLTFTGQAFDPESGLLYYKNRYYHPPLGRFISQDPLTYSSRVSLYECSNSNPFSYTDPLGLSEWTVVDNSENPGEIAELAITNILETSVHKVDISYTVVCGTDGKWRATFTATHTITVNTVPRGRIGPQKYQAAKNAGKDHARDYDGWRKGTGMRYLNNQEILTYNTKKEAARAARNKIKIVKKDAAAVQRLSKEWYDKTPHPRNNNLPLHYYTGNILD